MKQRKNRPDSTPMTEEGFHRWAETGSSRPMPFWKAALILGALLVTLYGLYALVIIGLEALGVL